MFFFSGPACISMPSMKCVCVCVFESMCGLLLRVEYFPACVCVLKSDFGPNSHLYCHSLLRTSTPCFFLLRFGVGIKNVSLLQLHCILISGSYKMLGEKVPFLKKIPNLFSVQHFFKNLDDYFLFPITMYLFPLP